MLKTEATDVTVIITASCPHCGTEIVEELGREPDELDTECTNCSESFTITL